MLANNQVILQSGFLDDIKDSGSIKQHGDQTSFFWMGPNTICKGTGNFSYFDTSLE
jgi:hypothetical protein